MRKIPREFENPLDDILIDWADQMSVILRATNHSPNVITTYSFVSALAALWALALGNIGWFGVLWALQYFWDCVDGHYARKYKMVTQFGDVYDHITDIIGTVGLAFLVYTKYHPSPWIYVIIGILAILLGIHTGCQQKVYNQQQSQNQQEEETMDSFKNMCQDTSWIRWTRFFGFGTFQVAIVATVMYLHHKKTSS